MNIVECTNVFKKRKDFAVENLNITIPQGYITGFIGENGSGKTTTIQLIMNVLRADQGEIKLFGKDHTDHNIKQKIGFVYDDLYMYDDFNIKKMKALISPLHDNWNEALFLKYLHAFELPLKKKIKHYSKGMKMKCSLLFALAHEPEFIIMDEPTSGLDPVFRREILELLQELMINDNQTVFLSTHITTDLDRIADYIVFIDQGEIVFQKSMEEIKDQFHLIKGDHQYLDSDTRELFINIKETDLGFTALFQGDSNIFSECGDSLLIEPATLEDIMYYMTRNKKEFI